jgi:hypothetical protein
MNTKLATALVAFTGTALVASCVLPRRRGGRGIWVCKSCGHVGRRRPHAPGSTATEVILYVVGLWPGVLYSMWRSGKSYRGCALCGSPDVVPAESPVGAKLVAETRHQEDPALVTA